MPAGYLVSLALLAALLPGAAGAAAVALPPRWRDAGAAALSCIITALCGPAAAEVSWSWPPRPPFGVFPWTVLLLAGIGAAGGRLGPFYAAAWMTLASAFLLRPMWPAGVRGPDLILVVGAALVTLATGVAWSRARLSGRAGAACGAALAVTAVLLGFLGGSARLAQAAAPMAAFWVAFAAVVGLRRTTPSQVLGTAILAPAAFGLFVVLTARFYADLGLGPALFYGAQLLLPPLLGWTHGAVPALIGTASAALLALLFAAQGYFAPTP